MMSDRSRLLVPWALGFAMLAASACATAPRATPRAGDAAFEEGAYGVAVTAYERELAVAVPGTERDRAVAAIERVGVMYRLALAHLALGDAAHRDRARELLEAVAAAQPETDTGRQAAILAAHLRAALRAEERNHRQARQAASLRGFMQRLRGLTAALATCSATNAEHVRELSDARDRLQAELAQAHATNAEQRGRIERLTQEIDRLTQQLDALKDIDLQRRP